MYAGKLSIAAAKVTNSDTVQIENRRTALGALQSKSKYIMFTKCLDLWLKFINKHVYV